MEIDLQLASPTIDAAKSILIEKPKPFRMDDPSKAKGKELVDKIRGVKATLKKVGGGKKRGSLPKKVQPIVSFEEKEPDVLTIDVKVPSNINYCIINCSKRGCCRTVASSIKKDTSTCLVLETQKELKNPNTNISKKCVSELL